MPLRGGPERLRCAPRRARPAAPGGSSRGGPAGRRGSPWSARRAVSSAGRVGAFRAGDPHHPRGLLLPSPSPDPRRGKCFPAGELAALRSAMGRKSPCFPPVWRWICACGLCVFLFLFLPSCAVFGAAGEVGSVFPVAPSGWFAPRSSERGSGCGGAGAAPCPFPEATGGALRAQLWRGFTGETGCV